MILEKLTSKKGQISIEIGILVSAAVAVATVASYYYLESIIGSGESIEATAKDTMSVMSNGTEDYIEKIDESFGDGEGTGQPGDITVDTEEPGEGFEEVRGIEEPGEGGRGRNPYPLL